MRSIDGRGTIYEALRDAHRALASLLLFGAMLAPVVEYVAGWPVHTPLGIPLPAHVAIIATLGVAAARATVRGRLRRDWRWLRWLLVPAIGVVLAAILRARANAFYTESALIDGMAVLFALRIGATMIRRRAIRRLGLAAAEQHAPLWARHGTEWRVRLSVWALLVTPGVRFADALTVLVGWLLLATWTLIALEHRHPAGPLLLLSGAIELLTLVVLIPDAFSGRDVLNARQREDESQTDPAGEPTIARRHQLRPTARTPYTLRRHS
jgi:hypothetical protein